jgi:hypothetical protein
MAKAHGLLTDHSIDSINAQATQNYLMHFYAFVAFQYFYSRRRRVQLA